MIYTQSIHVEHDIEKDWLQWMKEEALPEIAQTHRFSKIVFAKVSSHPDETGNTYSIQYYADDKNSSKDFYQNQLHSIAKSVLTRYGTKALIFPTELDVLAIYEK